MSNMCGLNNKGGVLGYCTCGATGCSPYDPKLSHKAFTFVLSPSHTLKDDGFYHPTKRDMTWKERRAHLEGLRK